MPNRRGFHHAADSISGGPGTADPGVFRCSNCTLETLIGKAFDLQHYEFPARASLADHTFEVRARVPAGATPEEFRGMLQNLLKERFGFAYHFTEKKMRGYRLVLAKNGSKLKAPASGGNDHAWGHGGARGHNGLMVFGSSARYRGDHQTAAQIAQLLCDQLSLPVEDQTALQGKYDVSLVWSGGDAHSDHQPASGGWAGAGTYGSRRRFVRSEFQRAFEPRFACRGSGATRLAAGFRGAGDGADVYCRPRGIFAHDELISSHPGPGNDTTVRARNALFRSPQNNSRPPALCLNEASNGQSLNPVNSVLWQAWVFVCSF